MSGATAPGICTWDATQPYRPGLGDFNGAALADRGKAPPNPTTMPNAALFNTTSITEVALCAVAFSLRVSVKFVAGAPVIDSATMMAGWSPSKSAPALTIVRTPSGAGSGDVFIYWPSNAFPTPTTRPVAGLNGSTPALAPAADWFSNGGNSGVRIVTQNASAAATDLPFTVEIP